MPKRIHKFPISLRLVLKSLAKYPVKDYSVNNINQNYVSSTQLCITFNMIDDDVHVSNAKGKWSRRHKFWFDKSFDRVEARNKRRRNGANSRSGGGNVACADDRRVVNDVSVARTQPLSIDAVREDTIAPQSGRLEDANPGVEIKAEQGISSDMRTLVVREVEREKVRRTCLVSKHQDVGACGSVSPDISGVDECRTSNGQTQIQQRKLVGSNSVGNTVNESNSIAEGSIKIEPTESTEADVRLGSSPGNVIQDAPHLPTQRVDDVHVPTTPERCQRPGEGGEDPDSCPLVPRPPTSKDVLYMKLADMSDKVYDVNPDPYKNAHGVFTITDFPGVESKFILNHYDKKVGTYKNIIPEGAGTVRKLICDLGVWYQSMFVRQVVARIVLSSEHDSMSNGELEWFVLLLK